MQLAGFRKIAFGFILVGIGIAMDKFVPGGLSTNLVELMKFVAVGFFLSNSAEHISGAIKEFAATRDMDGDGDVDGMDAQLEYLSSQNDELKKQVTDLKSQMDGGATALVTIQNALSFIIEKTGLNKK